MTAATDAWLALPILGWFAGYVALLWFFVPRMRDRSKVNSEARSALMGRIVDSYTNILTVKLFARPQEEDNYVRDAVERHTGVFLAAQRLLTAFGTILHVLNALLIASAVRVAIWLWLRGAVEVGVIAMVLPLDLAAHQHVAPDRDPDHRTCSRKWHRAGRHDDDRAPAAARRRRRRQASGGARGASRSSTCASVTSRENRFAKTGVNALVREDGLGRMPCSTRFRLT
jgi:hypothetical protein